MTNYTVGHNAPAKAKLNEICKEKTCIIKSAKAFFKQLDKDTQAKLEALYNEVKYTRRRYGSSDWYCWANHAIFSESPLDPWPANRFPKSVLIADIAIRTDIVKA